MTHLQIFAVNADLNLCHTHLTRAKGEAVDLPPLAAWLGVDALDTDRIELFPVKDLDDMRLSDYASLAFASETLQAQDRVRVDALEGSVLLVPSNALQGDPAPRSDLTLIATVPLVAPDHAATLPKAEVAPLPQEAPEDTPPGPDPKRGLGLLYALLGAGLLLLLLLLVF